MLNEKIKRVIAAFNAILIIGSTTGCNLSNEKKELNCNNYHLEEVLGDNSTNLHDDKIKKIALSEVHNNFMNKNAILGGKYVKDNRIEKLFLEERFFQEFNNDQVKKYMSKYIRSIEEEVDQTLSYDDIKIILPVTNIDEIPNTLECGMSFLEGENLYSLILTTNETGNLLSESIVSSESCYIDLECCFVAECSKHDGLTDYDLIHNWVLSSDNSFTSYIEIDDFPNISDQYIISLNHSGKKVERTITKVVAEKFIATMILAAKNSQKFSSYIEDNRDTLNALFDDEFNDFYYSFVKPEPKLVLYNKKI